MDIRCKNCFANTYDRLITKFRLSTEKIQEFWEYFNGLMVDSEKINSVEIQRKLHNKFQVLNGVGDPFFEDKQLCNQLAMKLYNVWKPKVLDSDNPFDMALRLTIAGNIMDYGADHEFNIRETIENVLHKDFAIDYSPQLKHCIREAESILYLGDNAGEIVFDKLFLEIIMHNNVTYAVKSGPIINDATLFDAFEVGLDNVADLISNGDDAPSTILEKSSHEFMEHFNSADLIISKGQGNLEGLISLKDKRIFFLLMVKCDVMADMLKVKKGSFVVFNQTESQWE
jgi:uncharacterized protein with ATP-grasp and redox domains